jgi:hypothetical protein
MDWLNRKDEPRDFEDRNLSDFEIGYMKAAEDREIDNESVASLSAAQSRETIKHAAVKGQSDVILLGKSHAECFQQAFLSGIMPSQEAIDQGFMTNAGRFVNRSEAAVIAGFAGQVDRSCTILFSEELWSEDCGGKFKYCPIRGYYDND